MDLTLLLSIVSVLTTVITIALLVMVLRRLGRHRRELTALRTAAEDRSARRRAGSDADDARDPAPVAGSGDDDRLHRIAVVLNPSKFAETESIRQRLSELVERI